MNAITHTDDAFHLLRLGDDGLILGQRLSEDCGHAPTLELDLSIANIALDLIGQAQHFLALAASRRGRGEDADNLAFGRDVLDFRNCLLVEQPNGDFAGVIVRQFLFSTWQEMWLRLLSRSRDAEIAAIAAKSVKETAYHASFAAEWVVRLGDGTAESRRRMTEALAWMWRFTPELFAPAPDDAPRIAAGEFFDAAELATEWRQRVGQVLARAGLAPPADGRPILGGRDGHHSEHLGHILSEMQFLQRAYPGAAW
jgi:ring-1,2-phenylacetyl-CoA epoxidase subunit PaaC